MKRDDFVNLLMQKYSVNKQHKPKFESHFWEKLSPELEMSKNITIEGVGNLRFNDTSGFLGKVTFIVDSSIDLNCPEYVFDLPVYIQKDFENYDRLINISGFGRPGKKSGNVNYSNDIEEKFNAKEIIERLFLESKHNDKLFGKAEIDIPNSVDVKAVESKIEKKQVIENPKSAKVDESVFPELEDLKQPAFDDSAWSPISEEVFEEERISFSDSDPTPKANSKAERTDIVFQEDLSSTNESPKNIGIPEAKPSSGDILDQDSINALLNSLNSGISFQVEEPSNEENAYDFTEKSISNSTGDSVSSSEEEAEFDISQFFGTPAKTDTSAESVGDESGNIEDLWAMAMDEDDTIAQNIANGLGALPEEVKLPNSIKEDMFLANTQNELLQDDDGGLDDILAAVLDDEEKPATAEGEKSETEESVDDFYIPDVYDDYFGNKEEQTLPKPVIPESDDDFAFTPNSQISTASHDEENEEIIIGKGLSKKEAGTRKQKIKIKTSRKKIYLVSAISLGAFGVAFLGYMIFSAKLFVFDFEEKSSATEAGNNKKAIVNRDFSLPVNYPYFKKDDNEKSIELPGNKRTLIASAKKGDEKPIKQKEGKQKNENTNDSAENIEKEPAKKNTGHNEEKTVEKKDNKVNNQGQNENAHPKIPEVGEKEVKANVFFDGKNYYAQISSFTLEFVANQEADRIRREKKVNVVVLKAILADKRITFRIRVGPYKNQQAAEDAQKNIK